MDFTFAPDLTRREVITLRSFTLNTRDVKGNSVQIIFSGNLIRFIYGDRGKENHWEDAYSLDNESAVGVFLALKYGKIDKTPLGIEGNFFEVSREVLEVGSKIVFYFYSSSQGGSREIGVWFEDFEPVLDSLSGSVEDRGR